MPLNQVYCEGWDPESRTVVGRLAAATARARDGSGEQYAIAVVEPGTGAVVAVVDIAWGHGFARAWRLDGPGRRTAVDEFRKLGDRLFHLRAEEWGYDDPGQPEFDRRARHVEQRFSPDGTVTRIVEPNGAEGGSRHTTVVAPVDDVYADAPPFGRWAALLRLDEEPVEQQDPEAEEAVESPWRPAVPMRAEALDQVFRPDVRWTLRGSDAVVVTEVRDGGVVRLTSGRVVAADPGWLSADLKPFETTVPPGDHRVELAVVRFVDDPDHVRVAAAKLVVSTEPVTSWEPALTAGQNPLLLGAGEFYGFGVDAGLGCFVDADALVALEKVLEESYDDTLAAVRDGGSVEVRDPESGATVVAYHSGWGDGAYPTWIGRTATGTVACFVADMLVLRGAAVVTSAGT